MDDGVEWVVWFGEEGEARNRRSKKSHSTSPEQKALQQQRTFTATTLQGMRCPYTLDGSLRTAR